MEAKQKIKPTPVTRMATESLEPNISTPVAGQAIQIISIQNEKFLLNEKNLKDILTHPNTKNKPVSKFPAKLAI